MPQILRRVMPLIGVAAALVVAPAAPARADASAPTLSPTLGPPGTMVTAAASDWIGCTSMSVSGWGSTLASGSISSSGAFTLRFLVPAVPVGSAQLVFSPTCTHSTWMPVLTFTVTADATAPTVSWAAPVGNQGTLTLASGTLTLSASASDNVGVARLMFYRWDSVNGVWVGIATLYNPPWQTQLNVAALNGAWNQINVQAWDYTGNASAAPYIWVYRTDTSPPTLSWIAPAGNGGVATVSSGTITLAVSATDNIAPVRVKFFRWDAIAGKLIDVATVSKAPWQTTLAVSPLNGGWNEIDAQAWDSVGNASIIQGIWVYRTVPGTARLPVPFATQMGTGGDPNSGSNNCGPASITMTIRYYAGSSTTPTVQDSATAIRGYAGPPYTPTDFKSGQTVSWLAKFGLVERNITTFDQVRGEVSAGRPVVIMVNNFAYRSLAPYPNDNSGWFTKNHIVVVTGYDATNVYLNDPLRSSGNFPVPISMFAQAASTTDYTTTTSWDAVSIARG